MGRPTNCTDEEFLQSVEALGLKGTAEAYGYSGEQAVRNRARALQRKLDAEKKSSVNVERTVQNGLVIIGSDAHYIPGLPPSTAHLAMVRLCDELHPEGVILNGDVIDASSVGRHPNIGWEKQPQLWQEVLEAQDRTDEIAGASDLAWKDWPLGNHDERFESYIANNAPQYRGVKGIHLKDHFPNWTPCYVVDINKGTEGWTVVQHAIRGGATAVTKNMMDTGTHIVTGHVHAANVYAYTNRRGTFYGVDCGTLAALPGPQFLYTRGKPLNWRSAVTVLTYNNGRLLPPEQLIVIDEAKRLTAFRGQVQKEQA